MRRHTWLPPILGEYKTNFDGVMISEGDEARIGIVVRHSSGKVLAAMAEKIQKPHSVECLEVIATRCAMIFCEGNWSTIVPLRRQLRDWYQGTTKG